MPAAAVPGLAGAGGLWTEDWDVNLTDLDEIPGDDGGLADDGDPGADWSGSDEPDLGGSDGGAAGLAWTQAARAESSYPEDATAGASPPEASPADIGLPIAGSHAHAYPDDESHGDPNLN
jgi:hypothetical protein